MKNGIQQAGMTGVRWRLVRIRDEQLAQRKTHYFHVSCAAYMMANPLGAHFPAIPHVDQPGKTYNVGRNKLKAHLKTLRK